MIHTGVVLSSRYFMIEEKKTYYYSQTYELGLR